MAEAHQCGSALVIAILIAVILTLLGVSFLMMAETENRIASNERHAAQALYAAEAGARAVRSWFDRPETGLGFPPPAVVDRSLQVLGGKGITEDTVVERIYRDIRAFRIYDGPSEVHRWALARNIMKRN